MNECMAWPPNPGTSLLLGINNPGGPAYFSLHPKKDLQARSPGTVEKRIADSDGRTDQWTEGGFNI